LGISLLSLNLIYLFSIKVIPHPQKVHKGGEDAYFANKKYVNRFLTNFLNKFSVLAVADGVGGWAEYGVDPALYSKELCRQ